MKPANEIKFVGEDGATGREVPYAEPIKQRKVMGRIVDMTQDPPIEWVREGLKPILDESKGAIVIRVPEITSETIGGSDE